MKKLLLVLISVAAIACNFEFKVSVIQVTRLGSMFTGAAVVIVCLMIYRTVMESIKEGKRADDIMKKVDESLHGPSLQVQVRDIKEPDDDKKERRRRERQQKWGWKGDPEIVKGRLDICQVLQRKGELCEQLAS